MSCNSVGNPPNNNTDSGSGLAGALGRAFRAEILAQAPDFDWSEDEFYALISRAVAQALIGDCGINGGLVTETFTANGITKGFLLTRTPVPGSTIFVFRAGLRVKKVTLRPSGQNQVVVNDRNVVFGAAPNSGDTIIIDYVPQD